MEIKSYKTDPPLSTTEKRPHSHHDSTEAVSPTPLNSQHTTQAKKKKLLIEKPPNDENQGKPGRKKPRESNANRASKRVIAKKTTVVPVQKEQEPVPIDKEAAKRQELEEMIEALDPNYNHKKRALKDIEFIFDSRLYDGNIPYHQDGNIEFYTKQNEEKRKSIKTNPLIIEALNNILRLYQFNKDDTLNKTEYIRMHTQIAKFMRKDLKDKALARLVEQDWKHDSNGKGYIEKDELYDSLFELGDIWTPEIDVFQYLVFFQRLFKTLRGEEEVSKPNETLEKKDNPYSILN